jgi:hypothetical protein
MRHSLISITLAFVVLAACGEEAPPPDPELPPLVGALEVPISLRNGDPTPSNALRIEMSPSAMHVDGHALYDMTRGEPPDSEQTPEGYTQLRTRIASLPARGIAALTIHGMIPYGTFVRTLMTLQNAGYHEFAIAVRRPDSSPTIHWMTFSSPEIVPSHGPVAFPGTERPWEDFTSHWEEVYTACRSVGDRFYIDCDGLPAATAPGGHLQLVLWARGDGMIMRFNQVDVEDAGVPPSTGVAMLPGVPQPQSDEEPPPRPFTTGAFSFRASVATQADSAMSMTARPVCGAAVCPTVLEADVGTNFMRVMSMIGAAFPTGSTAPRIAFRIPDR